MFGKITISENGPRFVLVRRLLFAFDKQEQTSVPPSEFSCSTAKKKTAGCLVGCFHSPHCLFDGANQRKLSKLKAL